MKKKYSEIAMDVINADWKARKQTNPSYYTQNHVSEVMNISRATFVREMNKTRIANFDFICAYAVAVGMDVRTLLGLLSLIIFNSLPALTPLM